MKKYNFKTKEYEDYKVPKEWKIKVPRIDLNGIDLNEELNCTNCGRKLKYGGSYTSLKIHDKNGIGFPVCYKCYEKEWKERNLYEEQV